jgi:hypothetical protein
MLNQSERAVRRVNRRPQERRKTQELEELLISRISVRLRLFVLTTVSFSLGGLGAFSPDSERLVQRLLASGDRTAHDEQEERSEEPVNILDMRDGNSIGANILNGELPITLKKPRRKEMTAPSEKLISLGLFDRCCEIHGRSARQRQTQRDLRSFSALSAALGI